jgi:hypothetical protein
VRQRCRCQTAVLAVQLTPGKQSLLGYHGGRTTNMLQIYLGAAQMVVRRIIGLVHYLLRTRDSCTAADSQRSARTWLRFPGGHNQLPLSKLSLL